MSIRFGGAMAVNACVLLAVLACGAPSRPPGEPAASSSGSPPAAPSGRSSMTMAVRYEVTDLAAKTLTGGPSDGTKRLFNAALSLVDGVGSNRPYLAEVLPQLNSDGWRVFPDGRMETTYRLKPNLTWHDGQPLTADDFVFAHSVYTLPTLAVFIAKPQDLIEEISAPDVRTLRIRWRALSPDAGSLSNGDLDPLPRHILEGPFAALRQDPSTQDAFLGNTYWTSQYVGPGPYRLDHWEPGSEIVGIAFAGHALGKPAIERFIVRIISDENTVMTNLLAGNIEMAVDNTLRFEHAMVLRREWGPGNRGVALLRPGTRHYVTAQFRPEYVKNPGVLDLRVRRALAHATDRSVLNEALFENEGLITEHYVPREMPYYADVERAITKYPYDPRRTEQLMGEAGYAKDRSGFYAGTSGERFRPEFWEDGSALFEREATLMHDTWGKLGIEMQIYMLPAAQVRNQEVRATFPDLYATSTGVSEQQLNRFSAGEVGTPANRWGGANRGGWIHPEYERLWAGFNSELERPRRNQYVVDMMKLLSDELPGIMLYFNIGVVAHVAALSGPEIGTPESLGNWNIHEWRMQ